MKYLLHYKYYTCRVLAKLGLLKYFSLWFTVKKGRKRFAVPVINGYGYYNLYPFKEEWMQTLVQRLCTQRKGCIIDVGVNLAQTLLKIAAIDDTIAYYGFEPNPVCYHYSIQLAKRNGLISFRVFPVGLSNEAAIVKLFGDTEYASGASIVENFRENKSRYPPIHYVPVMQGDTVLQRENIGAVNFIKIDVEGAELEVIEGLQKTLRETKPVIIMEILPVYSIEKENGKMRKDRQDKLLGIMHGLGFALFLIKEQEIKLQFLENIPVHGNMATTNYLFIPREQVDDFKDMIE